MARSFPAYAIPTPRSFNRRIPQLLRRSGRGGGGGGSTPASRFAALFVSGGSWFDADNTTQDPTTLKVSGLVDQADPSHVLSQAASSSVQVALAVADAKYGGARTLQFTGTQYYVSSRAASAWRFLHDGSGFTSYLLFTAASNGNKQMWGTRDNTTLATGMNEILNASGLSAFVTNGASVVVSATHSVTAGAALAEKTVWRTARSPNWALFTGGTQQISGANGATPTPASDPVMTLALGGSAVAGQASFGFRALYIFPRELSTAEDQTVKDFVLSQTGLAA